MNPKMKLIKEEDNSDSFSNDELEDEDEGTGTTGPNSHTNNFLANKTLGSTEEEVKTSLKNTTSTKQKGNVTDDNEEKYI